jgi:peroxiredoxin Q/BCP
MNRLLVLGLSLLGACAPVSRPDGGSGLLPVGAIAPEVVGTSRDGQAARLSAVRGHAAVVYFYPKDETPGCTHEACAFRDAFAKYEARHVTIFGVSRDSDESHAQFRASHSLPFPLVADEDGTVARAYGVPSTLGMASRVTFLVGRDGRIARVWPDVDPGVHAAEVLAAVDAVEGGGSTPAEHETLRAFISNPEE